MGRVTNSPHLLNAPPCDYTLVIPTKGRWREACIVNPLERKLKNVREPFLLVKTLSLLERQLIPVEYVSLFVNGEQEHESYRKALAKSTWKDVKIVVGVDGILEQRNFIQDYYPEGTYIVSLDDDLEQIWFKPSVDCVKLDVLPAGGLQQIIYDAMGRMIDNNAYIWGFNVTSETNVRNIHPDGLSSRNGEINGFLYGFRNRHLEELKPKLSNAIEDAERSVRYFAKDGIILRYLMYVCSTKCYRNGGGLQELFGQKDMSESLRESNLKRKEAEQRAANELHLTFPDFIGKPHATKEAKTLVVTFLPKGGKVIPCTTEELLKKARRPKWTPKKRDAENTGVRPAFSAARVNPSPLTTRKRRLSMIFDRMGLEPGTSPSSPIRKGVGEIIAGRGTPSFALSVAHPTPELTGPKHVFFDASTNSVFVADTTNDRVVQFPLPAPAPRPMAPSSSSTSPPPLPPRHSYDPSAFAQHPSIVAGRKVDPLDALKNPNACVVDLQTGALFVCDSHHHRILRYDTHGSKPRVVAGGNGSGSRLDQLAYPTHVCCSAGGTALVIADAWNKRVVCWPFGSKEGIVVCGKRPTSQHHMDQQQQPASPHPQTEDCECVDDECCEVTPVNKSIPLDVPFAICVDRDMRFLYVADGYNHRVVKCCFALNTESVEDANNEQVCAGGNGEGSSLNQLSFPSGVAVDGQGNVYVADENNHRIVKWPPGAPQGIIVAGGYGFGDSLHQLWHPAGLFLEYSGDTASGLKLLVADTWNHRVMRFDPDKWVPPNDVTTAGHAKRVFSDVVDINGTSPRRARPLKRRRIRRPPKGLGRKCNVAGCAYVARGRVYEADDIGPDGPRCTPHGGRRCAATGCISGATGCFMGADEFGPSGPRCLKHGGRRCQVQDCDAVSIGKKAATDPYGPPGRRCDVHTRPQAGNAHDDECVATTLARAHTAIRNQGPNHEARNGHTTVPQSAPMAVHDNDEVIEVQTID
eukprot:GEMP01004309.1.p1 GENE.GEMP01004309.1~~GEMP01004309.1.p1  ORF type:complete len:977 (+),score=254.86 GEMP01004309.1:239-3169(+)